MFLLAPVILRAIVTINMMYPYDDIITVSPYVEYMHALRVCTKSWDTNYSDLLVKTHLPSLQARRQQTKLCNLFNMVNHFTFFPDAPIQARQFSYPSRSVHARALVPLQTHSSQYYNSFFPSAITAWNSLPVSNTV